MDPIDKLFGNNGTRGPSTNTKDRVINAYDHEVDVDGVGYNDREASEKVMNDPNETEVSSSFGNTFSGSEEELAPTDTEVESNLFSRNPEHASTSGLSRPSKKGRVTNQWRSYISPLMWRCQWLELRMNELSSQALFYEKELAACRREKQYLKMMKVENSVSRAIPFPCQTRRKSAMKRRRRKRVEDNVNVSSYMASHNVFSYYERKCAETGCPTVDNCTEVQEVEVDEIEVYENLLRSLRSDGDSIEETICNLDHLQYRVAGLKSQLESVMPKYSHINLSLRNNAMPAQTTSDSELKVSGSPNSSFGDDGVIATDDARIRAKAVKILLVEDLSDDDMRELNKLSDEEKEAAPYGCEDAMAYLKVPVSAPAVKKARTVKKRGRKPKKLQQVMSKKDENINPYQKIYRNR